MSMKRFLILFICLAAVFACDKPDNKQLDPTTINGNWVISAENGGAGWIDLPVSTVYTFDGKGSYTVRTLEPGTPATSYFDGRVYADETSFVQSDKKVYTSRHADAEYHFESLPGTYRLTSSSYDQMVFNFEGTPATVKGYKFSKVILFKAAAPDPESGTINGTTIAEWNDLVGLIKDSKTGKGIPGVVVSDGYDCVRTDENGVYQLKSNELTRMIYYSTPSEYKVATGATRSIPVFYKAINPVGARIRTDFQLDPLEGGKETKWTFIGIGDPQCATASNADRYTTETISDIKQALANRKNVYAMTLGDIVFDSTNMWPAMVASMSSVLTGTWYIPFFQTIGNHDHDSLQPDTSDNAKDDYLATSTFESYFGPVNYSFNRGDVHIVSMDDIMVTSQKESGKSNGKTWSYSGGFTDKQIEWLKKDLALVPDKQDKMIFVCCHIQFRNSSSNNYQEVLKLMDEFKEAHLMIGHTHYTQNFIYTTSHKAKGGLPVYEHIHGSACGAWWTKSSSSTVSGEPSGYTIYEIEGAHINDWMFKGTRKDADFQLRVYDGNEIYYTSQYPLNWYTSSQTVGSYTFTVKGNTALKNCFVAQVFNDDDTYWTVELRRKSTGQKIGNFTRLANGTCSNIAMSAHYYNKKSKTSDSYRSWTASHYWYYKPASGNPAGETDWEVVATHKLPGGTAQHVFTCSKMTTEADFEKEFYF